MDYNKFIFSLVILFALVLQLNAQEKEKQKVLFNEWWISTNRMQPSNESSSDLYGFGFGLNKVSEESKIMYSIGVSFNQMKLYEEEVFIDRFSKVSDVNFTLKTFSVPLALRLNIDKNRKFYLKSGLQLDLLLSAKQHGTYRVFSISQNQFEDVRKKENASLNNFNCGFTIGAGSEFQGKKLLIGLRVNYFNGILNLSPGEDFIDNNYVSFIISLRKK